MNQSLKLTVGLPGSGKTTWAKSWVAENPEGRVRVCRNDIRRMLGPSTIMTNQREALVSIIESTAVRNALRRGYDVIIDAHHLNPKVIAKWESYVNMINKKDDINLDIEFINLNTPLDVCISRDESRKADQRVGKSVIYKLHEKYLKKDIGSKKITAIDICTGETKYLSIDDMEW